MPRALVKHGATDAAVQAPPVARVRVRKPGPVLSPFTGGALNATEAARVLQNRPLAVHGFKFHSGALLCPQCYRDGCRPDSMYPDSMAGEGFMMFIWLDAKEEPRGKCKLCGASVNGG